MVRRFKGHKDRVTGVVISQDARWLLSSSMDGTVRVWDIPAASCLQVPTCSSLLPPGHSFTNKHALQCTMKPVETNPCLSLPPTSLLSCQSMACAKLKKAYTVSGAGSESGLFPVLDVYVSVQVVKLGSPVTGLQLSPGQDLLATCHVKRRGIYLWYNHLMFGSGADIQPSTRPVSASLPSIATGQCS